MKWIRALLASAILLAAWLSGTAHAERGRFPGFVYTSPESTRAAEGALVALKYLGAGACKPGEWDTTTRAATRRFQRDHFLRPDGLLDRDTMALLASHEPRRSDAKR